MHHGLKKIKELETTPVQSFLSKIMFSFLFYYVGLIIIIIIIIIIPIMIIATKQPHKYIKSTNSITVIVNTTISIASSVASYFQDALLLTIKAKCQIYQKLNQSVKSNSLNYAEGEVLTEVKKTALDSCNIAISLLTVTEI